MANVTEDEWAQYHKRLTLHAGGFFVAYGWRANGGWAGPGGITPGDIAAEAILKVLDGTRRYDPSTGLKLMTFLRNVVRSLVNHLAEAANTQHSRPMPQIHLSDTEDPVDMEPEGDEPDPLDNCIKNETLANLKAMSAKEDDPLLVDILECMNADITKPAEIAEYLNVDVKTINNAQKRLWRKAEKMLGRPKREGRS
jgi:DNA-directed RNA polymerase specialized sigma24 family protein